MLKAISTITNALGALNYKGTWNALTNTPTLADGAGAKGDYYVVSTAGTQTFGGVQLFFGIGDWIVYNGAVWQRVEGGSDGNFTNVTLTSTDAGATASPLLELYRDSASPAVSDTLGEIEFNGEDSAGNKQAYGLIHASILSPTSTTEQGQLHFETATAGALTEKMIIGTSNLVVNEIGAVFNVRIEGDTDANLFTTDATNDRVGVGTLSPTVKFEVNGAAKASSLSLTTPLPIASGGTNLTSFTANGVLYASSATVLATNSGLLFDGNSLLLGTTSLLGTERLSVLRTVNSADYVAVFKTTAATATNNYGTQTILNGDPNDATRLFLSCIGGAATTRAQIRSNGGIANYTANDVNLSDSREKTNFAPAKSYLDVICAIPVQTFNYIDQNLEEDGGLTLGVVAQDVQAVAPELVMESNWAGKDEEPKMRLGIYQTDLQYALMKCIQEQQVLINKLQDDIEIIKNLNRVV
jgi:hypothetical protein